MATIINPTTAEPEARVEIASVRSACAPLFFLAPRLTSGQAPL